MLMFSFVSASCITNNFIVRWSPAAPSCCDALTGTQTGYNSDGEACETRTVDCRITSNSYYFIVRWDPSTSSCCEGDTFTATGYNCGGIAIDTRTEDCTGDCSPPCTPDCSGKTCGDDGCGGSCGTCSSGYSCSGGSCVAGACVSAGGVIADCGGVECCKFSSSSCPSSWVQQESWSSASGRGDYVDANCFTSAYPPCDCCHIVTGLYCSIEGYSWSNQDPTCKSCSDVCTPEGQCNHESQCGFIGYEKCGGSTNSMCQSITEIGCVLLESCGDGIIDSLEECDDGNIISGDGCSSSCQIEQDWNCTGEPSFCIYNCQLTSSNWSTSETTDGNLVNLNVQGVDCDGKAVSFEVFENELVGRDVVQTNPVNVTFSGSSATGTWIAEWIDDGFAQGNPEYVFKASLVSNPNVEIDDSGEMVVLPSEAGEIDCDNVTSCSNYLTSGSCVSDLCGVVDGSVESNNPFVDCSAGDTNCECSWVLNSCKPSYTNVAGGYVVGTCSYDESTSDDCTDGILSYSWSASWTWGHEGWIDWNDGPSANVGDYELDNGKYYYDPDRKFDGCVDGNTIVECPASIQVGFFGTWNFVIAIIVLVGVYFFEGKKKVLENI